jgi:hypothetical protein
MGQIHYDGADRERQALCSVWRLLNEAQPVSHISARDEGGFSFYIADGKADFRGFGGKALASVVSEIEGTSAVIWAGVERLGGLVIEASCHLMVAGAPAFICGTATRCLEGGKKEASIVRQALADFRSNEVNRDDDIWTEAALQRLMPRPSGQINTAAAGS